MTIKYDIDQEKGYNVGFQKRFYNQKKAQKIFDKLEEQIEYNSDEDSKVVVFGKEYVIPRKQVAYGNEGTFYKFSGNCVPAKPWPTFLKKIKKDVEEATGQEFNFVLVNRYADGKHNIGYHKDDEDDLAHTIIASLSFGASRDFLFKHDIEGKKQILLESGDLILMCPPTNSHWKHSVPKRMKVKEPRVNLTFRYLKN